MRLLPCRRNYNETSSNSKQIDREIKHWMKTYNEAIKLLLLGTGESGKSTILKQMRILHVQGFSNSERENQVLHIRHNVHESIYDILRNMSHLGIGLQKPKHIRALQYILKCGPDGPPVYDEHYFDCVRVLWRDGGVKECYNRCNEYQLLDSAQYFLDRIDLIEKSDFNPTDADILRCRQKTSGIQKIEFKVKIPKSGIQEFWMFDVGGQRGERKKWIQVFDGINAIWFLVACSDFDQTLREDNSQNRLRESLELFEDVWHSRFLLEAGLIVFLNKQDLLEAKISQGRSIAPYFPEYSLHTGSGDEYTRTKTFIRNIFVDVTTKQRSLSYRTLPLSGSTFAENQSQRARECYFHFTTATDTASIQAVLKDVHHVIMKHMLASTSLH